MHCLLERTKLIEVINMYTNLPTITIGCPISNRAYLIDRYLDGILKLDYPKEKINIYFLINNCNDGTDQELRKFKSNNESKYNSIILEKYRMPFKKDARVSHIRSETYHRLAELRNYVLKQLDTEYFFSVDSDIILETNVLIELIKLNLDCVAVPINNDKILKPYNTYPNIRTNLLTNNGNLITHIMDFPLNKLIEVEYTGAVYLMSKAVYSSCQYAWSPYGEDIPFCENVRKNGFKIYAHTGLWQKHIMCEYQSYCIENKCSKPCMMIDGKVMVYQYKYRDNEVFPSLIRCPKLVKGEVSLLKNDISDDVVDEKIN